MKLGRYHQFPTSLNFLQSSSKATPRSLYNSAPKNPEHQADMMKLPSLTMRKSASSFTMERNTRNNLAIITQKVQQMQADVHNARMDASETLNHLRFVKQQFIQNKLVKDSQDLKAQISGLKKLLHITKTTHQNRSNDLRQDYIRLWNQTEELRQMVFNLRMRMDKIEDVMGSKYE